MRDAQEMIPGTSLNCSDSISISKEAFDNDPKASLKRITSDEQSDTQRNDDNGVKKSREECPIQSGKLPANVVVEQRLFELMKENEALKQKLEERGGGGYNQHLPETAAPISSRGLGLPLPMGFPTGSQDTSSLLLRPGASSVLKNPLLMTATTTNSHISIPIQSASGSAFSSFRNNSIGTPRYSQNDLLLPAIGNSNAAIINPLSRLAPSSAVNQQQPNSGAAENIIQNYLLQMASLIGYDPRSTMPGANAEIVQHPRNFSQFEPSGSKQNLPLFIPHPHYPDACNNELFESLLLQPRQSRFMLEKPVNEQAQKLSVITSTGSKSFRSHSEPKYKKQMNPNNGGESTPYSISQSPPLPDSSSDRNATKHSDQQTTSDLLVYEDASSTFRQRPPVLFNHFSNSIMPSHYTDHGCPSSVLPFSFQHVSSAQQRSHQNNMMFDVDMPSCSGNQAGNVNQPSLSSHAEIGVIKRTGDLLVKKMDAQNGEGPSCSSSKLQTPNPATTSTSALSSILAASTKRTSPTVPQSRTELYSGLSTPVKSSSSVQPDSPPKVEENKNNNDKNNESSEDSSGHSPMNSSFSGTSPSSSSLQGSGSGVTMCSSEEAALHGSSSPPSSDPLRLLNTYVTLDNGHLPRSTRHDSENTPLNLSSSSSKSESRRAGRLRSDDHLDYQRYRDRRQRNNEAAKRCRANRRIAFEQRSRKILILETENAELRQEMLKLNSELEHLKSIIATHSHNAGLLP